MHRIITCWRSAARHAFALAALALAACATAPPATLPPGADVPAAPGAAPAAPPAPPAKPQAPPTTSVNPPSNVNLQGFPLAYRQGYADGCASATGPERKDATRIGSDGNYRVGWQDGFALCRRK